MWLDLLKRLLHSEHLYGLSPVWTFIYMWLCKCEDRLNAFSHTWLLYGFSPLWILLCTASSHDVIDHLLQTVGLYSNGFSPEWLWRCTARWWRVWQHLPHSVNLYEYSYGDTGHSEKKNVSHTENMKTYLLQCVSCCAYSNFDDFCNVCDTLYTNTALSCQDVDALSYRYYQLLKHIVRPMSEWNKNKYIQTHLAESKA